MTKLQKNKLRHRRIINVFKKVCVGCSTLVLLTALFACSNENTIKIATKPMSEQFVLAEMLGLLIEQNTDLNVEITKGIGGGTSNIHPAIVKGDFDMYPEYTGTGWSFVLKKDGVMEDKALFEQLKKEYEEQFSLTWVGEYGFNNTYAMCINKDFAQKNNIKTSSDLAPYTKDLVFGAEYDFYERDDGYDALISAYGYDFKDAVDIDIGLKYEAINSNKIQAMTAFTTDGQLANSELLVIEDDKKFFQSYYASTIVRQDTLEKYPQLESVLMLMNNIITNEEMSQLNYEVETNKRDEKEVAREFLTQKGLL